MHLFRGDQRKALAQIETHLVAEHTACAGAGAVCFLHAKRVHMAHEIFVGRGDGEGRSHGESLRVRFHQILGNSSPWVAGALGMAFIN